jgi:hypothetical protein
MFGTNDVYDEQHVLIEQSLENMGYIIDAAQNGACGYWPAPSHPATTA